MRPRRWVVPAVSFAVLAACKDKGDDGASPEKAASEYLAERDIAAAQGAYEQDIADDPDNLSARFGAAFTRTLLLPELPPITAVLTQCGQPAVDVRGQIFGDHGLIAHEIAHRAGTAALTLAGGPTGTNEDVAFVPTRMYTRGYGLDSLDGDIDIDIEQPSNATVDGRIRISLYINPDEAYWAVGQTINLATHYNVGFDIDSDEESVSHAYQVVSGTVSIQEAGDAVGENIRLTFTDVHIDRMRYDDWTKDGEYTLNGSFSDRIMGDFEPDHAKMPFMDVEDIEGPPHTPGMITVLESCNPPLSIPKLLEVVDDIVAELDIVRGHLDAIANSSSAGSFYWELPVGTLANEKAIPVGITEVHLLRASLWGADGLNSLIQQYHYLDAELRSLVATYTQYDGGSTRQVHDLDPELVAPELNKDFLRAIATLDMTSLKNNLTTALNAGKAALQATPTSNTLLNFQAAGSRDAANELVGLTDTLIASLTSPQTDDNGQYTIHPSSFITAPFDRDSLRSVVGDDLWLLTPRDAGSQSNAEIEPHEDFLQEMLDAFVALPNGPGSDLFCTTEAQCTAQEPDGEVWDCNDYSDDSGVCAEDMVTFCNPGSYPGPCSQYCVDSICGSADPVFFDIDVVDNAFDQEPPPFVNEDLLRSLEGAF